MFVAVIDWMNWITVRRRFHWAIDEGTNSFANGFNVEFWTSDEATSNAAIIWQISCELSEWEKIEKKKN